MGFEIQVFQGFDNGLIGGHHGGVKTHDEWTRRVERRLQQAGFSVSLLDPAHGAARKKFARRRDLKLLKGGKASPEELQERNSLFRRRAKGFRILDYGGLDEES